MNASRLIGMVLRKALRRLATDGVGGRAGKSDADIAGADMTAAERAEAKAARQTARRARQAIRAGRRIGRF